MCECKCRLNKNVCNSKQKCDPGECRCKCKKLDDWCSYENDYMGNPSTQDCERNRACKVDEYLDIKNSSCGKRLVDK